MSEDPSEVKPKKKRLTILNFDPIKESIPEQAPKEEEEESEQTDYSQIDWTRTQQEIERLQF